MNDPEVLSAAYWLSWIDPLKTFAEVGVVVCLAFGVILSFIGAPLSKKVENAREAEIARLQNETAQAQREIAEANARQQEAEERTEQIRAAFERNVMPRRLSSQEFEAALKGFPTATVEVLYDSHVPDAMPLAASIAIARVQSNWNVVRHGSPSFPFQPMTSLPQESVVGIPWPYWLEGRGNAWGVALISNKGPDLDALPPDAPIQALQRAIHKSGAEASTSVGANPNLPDGLIRLVIGDKTPSAPMSPEQLRSLNPPPAKAPETEKK